MTCPDRYRVRSGFSYETYQGTGDLHQCVTCTCSAGHWQCPLDGRQDCPVLRCVRQVFVDSQCCPICSIRPTFPPLPPSRTGIPTAPATPVFCPVSAVSTEGAVFNLAEGILDDSEAGTGPWPCRILAACACCFVATVIAGQVNPIRTNVEQTLYAVRPNSIERFPPIAFANDLKPHTRGVGVPPSTLSKPLFDSPPPNGA